MMKQVGAHGAVALHWSCRFAAALRCPLWTIEESCVNVGFAAGLFQEPDVGDGDAFIQGLAHVVESQSGNICSRERFHFDSGFAAGLGGASDGRSPPGELDIDLHAVQWKWMAEGDQLACLLRSHDAGENRGLEDWAFLGNQVLAVELSRDRFIHMDLRFSSGLSGGDILCGDIDHRSLVRVVDVGKRIRIHERGESGDGVTKSLGFVKTAIGAFGNPVDREGLYREEDQDRRECEKSHEMETDASLTMRIVVILEPHQKGKQ